MTYVLKIAALDQVFGALAGKLTFQQLDKLAS
jgi:hypothetical protein